MDQGCQLQGGVHSTHTTGTRANLTPPFYHALFAHAVRAAPLFGGTLSRPGEFRGTRKMRLELVPGLLTPGTKNRLPSFLPPFSPSHPQQATHNRRPSVRTPPSHPPLLHHTNLANDEHYILCCHFWDVSRLATRPEPAAGSGAIDGLSQQAGHICYHDVLQRGRNGKREGMREGGDERERSRREGGRAANGICAERRACLQPRGRSLSPPANRLSQAGVQGHLRIHTSWVPLRQGRMEGTPP